MGILSLHPSHSTNITISTHMPCSNIINTNTHTHTHTHIHAQSIATHTHTHTNLPPTHAHKPTQLPLRYVAEQEMNRVLRFVQRPQGVYLGSVFIQLSGGMGPSCLALDAQGSLYIGQFETRGTDQTDKMNFKRSIICLFL